MWTLIAIVLGAVAAFMLITAILAFVQGVQALPRLRPEPAGPLFGVLVVALVLFGLSGCGAILAYPSGEDLEPASNDTLARWRRSATTAASRCSPGTAPATGATWTEATGGRTSARCGTAPGSSAPTTHRRGGCGSSLVPSPASAPAERAGSGWASTSCGTRSQEAEESGDALYDWSTKDLILTHNEVRDEARRLIGTKRSWVRTWWKIPRLAYW